MKRDFQIVIWVQQDLLDRLLLNIYMIIIKMKLDGQSPGGV